MHDIPKLELSVYVWEPRLNVYVWEPLKLCYHIEFEILQTLDDCIYMKLKY